MAARPPRSLRRWRSVASVALITLAAGTLVGLPVKAAGAGAATSAASDLELPTLLTNGGFETPVPGSNGSTVHVTGTDLPGWNVPTGDVEVDSTLPAQSPTHFVDLNGNSPGVLSQTVSLSGTTPTRLHLSFYVAARPTCGKATASLDWSWSSGVSHVTQVATATNTFDNKNPGWTFLEADVVAAAATSTLSFTTHSTSPCGPLLDTVRLVQRPATLTGVALTADVASTSPGAEQVPVEKIPFSEIAGSALSAVTAAPLRSVPLRSVPLRSVPLGSVPLRSIPLRSVPLSVFPLRSVTLNQLPLTGTTTWSDILASSPYLNLPLQNITLDEVLDLLPDSLSLADVDVSASPLRSISLASVYLGDLNLGALLGTDGYATFCAGLAGGCPSTVTAGSPVLAADLAGIPLRSIPLRSVPLRSIATSSAPLLRVPLRSITAQGAPLRSIPLRSIATGTIGALSLSDLQAFAPLLTELGYAGLSGRSGFGPCPTACTSLGEAVHEQVVTASVADLVGTGVADAADLTLADLGPWDLPPLAGLTIGDLASSLSTDDVSIADALLSLVDPASVPWESVPFSEVPVPGRDDPGLASLHLPEYATSPALVTYTATFALGGGGAAGPVKVEVSLPAGFDFARMTGGARPAPTPTGSVAGGQTLTWTLSNQLPGGGATALTFQVHPSLTLTPSATAALTVTAGGTSGTLVGSATTSVAVLDNGASASTPLSGVPAVEADTLVVGHTSQAHRATYVKVPVPSAGTRVSFLLSHLPIDGDLVVYRAGGSDTAPSAAPLRSIPLRSVPLPDPGVDATGSSSAPTTLQDDVPLVSGLTVVGSSTQRGTSDEEVDTLSSGGGGYYLVQVTGYNGAYTPAPWVLRTQEIVPPTVSCPGFVLPQPAAGLSASGPALGTATRALFLVDVARLTGEYGVKRVGPALSALSALAARSDVQGAVVDVSTLDAVAAADAGWAKAPCSVEAANAVVRALTDLVRQAKGAAPALSSVTVVGGDEQLPMARVPDLTSAVNERGFADGDAGPGGADNPYTAAQRAGYLLSDDPYGTLTATPWLDRALYVPQLAVGRLVETPEQITAQLRQFVSVGGVVDPSSALTTGYDFLSDGATAVDRALAGDVGSTGSHQILIDESWTRQQVLDALFPGGSVSPRLVSLNAHFDQSRALPAAGNSSGSDNDLLTAADVAAHPQALAGRVLFSMGCHAGLSVPLAYSGIAGSDAATADWAKQLAGTQTALWVANTGYGLGDTATVALSEALMRDFAQRLDGSLTAGAALAYAKQAYLGSLGAYGAADEKALQEVAFYGLPMWRIGGKASNGASPLKTTAPAPVPTVSTAEDAATGLPSYATTTTLSFQRSDSTSGSYWSVNGQTQTTAGLPVQPRTSLPVTPSSGSVGTAHGVLVTRLSSHDVPGVTPRFARAVVDQSGNEPAQPVTRFASTTPIAGLTTSSAPGGQATSVILVPGQFLSASNQVAGTQRLFDSVGTRTFYSTSTDDYRAPTFTNLQAERSADGTSLTFTLTVTPPSGTTVKSVLVLAHTGGAATWTPVWLTPQDATTWKGSLTTLSSKDTVEWFAQAVGSTGTVAVSTGKGRAFLSPGDFQVVLHGPRGDNGWFTGPVTVTVTGPSASYTATVDGVSQPVFGSVVVSGDGTHTVVVTGSNGRDTWSQEVRIDATPPTVTVVGSPFDLGSGTTTASLRCNDETSGLTAAGCPGPISLDISRLGTFTVPLPTPVSDQAGNRTTAVSYRVQGTLTFQGFDPPVVNSDAGINDVQAGSTVPVKFSLFGASGAHYSDPAAVIGFTSKQVGCTSGTSTSGDIPPTSDTGLTVKADGSYSYAWRTDPAWAGTCRVFTAVLASKGGSPTAYFRFHS